MLSWPTLGIPRPDPGPTSGRGRGAGAGYSPGGMYLTPALAHSLRASDLPYPVGRILNLSSFLKS